MILFLIPNKTRIYAPLLPEEEKNKIVRNEKREVGGFEIALNQWTSEQIIVFYDLNQVFSQKAVEGEQLYWSNDGHLNPDGVKLVSDQVIKILSKDNLYSLRSLGELKQ
jgi:hypothetical protein